MNAPLFVTRHGVARIRRSVDSDPFARRVADSVLSDADCLMDLPPLLLEREPGRSVILPTARRLYDRVAVLGMASILTGNNRYRRRGVSELENATAFDSWNPSHFLDVAEMACGFALGLEWFGPATSHTERVFLEDSLAERALRPGLDQLRAAAHWTTAAHNWNVVCCSGLIVAALAVGARHAELAGEVIARATAALAHGLSSFEFDGGYAEGPGYWEHSARYAVVALAALSERGFIIPDPAGLAASWLFNRETTAPSGACFDFGDTVPHPGRSPILGWLASHSGQPEAALWQRTSPGNLHPFDLLWLSEEQESSLFVQKPVTAFQGAGICILRKSIGTSEAYIGFKGGRNDINHAHLDLGSFVFEVGKIRFISELGRDDYALPGYFDLDARFSYFRLGTAGHSTITFNGRSQSLGAHARWLGTSDQVDFVAAAFEIEDESSPVRHRRGIVIDGEYVWIVDEITRKHDTLEPIRINWRAFTQAEIFWRQRAATLTIGGQTLAAEIVDSGDVAWIVDPVASPPGEGDNSGFTCLRLETEMTGSAQRLCVAVSAPTTQGSIADRMPPPSIDLWPLTLPRNAG